MPIIATFERVKPIDVSTEQPSNTAVTGASATEMRDRRGDAGTAAGSAAPNRHSTTR